MPTMYQLVELTQFPERTIRNYTNQGLLPPTVDGLYTETHVRLLSAIGRLQMEGVRSIDVLRSRLESMSPAQLQRFIEHDDGPVEDTTQAAPAAVVAVIASTPAHTAEPTRQEWERIVLAPGLELHVRRDAPAEVRQRAERIAAGEGIGLP